MVHLESADNQENLFSQEQNKRVLFLYFAPEYRIEVRLRDVGTSASPLVKDITAIDRSIRRCVD